MKRLFNVLIAVVILALSATIVYAEGDTQYEEKAQQLKELGLLAGTDKGFELERAPKRVESAVMLIRLLGVESEVKAGSYSHPFTDVPSWADKYIGYMYENGLTKGIGDNKFGSDDLTDARGYATFVLRSLGYDDSVGEFNWATSVETGVDKGILTAEEQTRLQSGKFLRDDMVNFSVNALSVKLNGQEVKLIEELVGKGAVQESIAMSQGIIVEKEAVLYDIEFQLSKVYDSHQSKNRYLNPTRKTHYEVYTDVDGEKVIIDDVETIEYSISQDKKNEVYTIKFSGVKLDTPTQEVIVELLFDPSKSSGIGYRAYSDIIVSNQEGGEVVNTNEVTLHDSEYMYDKLIQYPELSKGINISLTRMVYDWTDEEMNYIEVQVNESTHPNIVHCNFFSNYVIDSLYWSNITETNEFSTLENGYKDGNVSLFDAYIFVFMDSNGEIVGYATR